MNIIFMFLPLIILSVIIISVIKKLNVILWAFLILIGNAFIAFIMSVLRYSMLIRLGAKYFNEHVMITFLIPVLYSTSILIFVLFQKTKK